MVLLTKPILTTKYDDRILELTSNWRHANDIVRKVGGDKSAISQALKRLVEIDHLQVKPNSNKILYKRKDTAQSEYNFLSMMNTLEANQKIELNRLKQLPTLMMDDGKRLRAKGIDLMDHILEEVKRAELVKVRLDYQKKLSLIPHNIANERIEILGKYIEKIMSAVMSKHKETHTIKTIQEYFQNHTTKLEFKI